MPPTLSSHCGPAEVAFYLSLTFIYLLGPTFLYETWQLQCPIGTKLKFVLIDDVDECVTERPITGVWEVVPGVLYTGALGEGVLHMCPT